MTALWDVWQALTSQGEAALRAQHGLDLRSFIALAYIRGGTHQPTALAQALGVPRYEVSRVLQGLEARGAVLRGQRSQDARQVQVTVTPHGDDLCTAALSTVQATVGPALRALGPRLPPLAQDLQMLAHAARLTPQAAPPQESI